MEIKNYLSVTDINLAATLYALGYTDINLDKTNRQRVVFLFVQDAAIDASVEGYWSDRIKLSPRIFADSLRHLKTMLYSR